MNDGPPFESDEDSSAVAGGNDREAHLAELRAAVERGLEDVKAGRVADPDLAFDRIEAILDELEAAKRAKA